jgi:hypothetical protein
MTRSSPLLSSAGKLRWRDLPSIRDALIALWEASDRLCGQRLVVMIPTLLPALERHGRLKLCADERPRHR